MSPQCRQIAEYLVNHGSITTLEAAVKLDPPCMRLSERIREMEKDGWTFHRAMPEPRKHYVRYSYITMPLPLVAEELFRSASA